MFIVEIQIFLFILFHKMSQHFLLKKNNNFLFVSSVNVNILLCDLCAWLVTHTANYSRIIDSTEFPRKTFVSSCFNTFCFLQRFARSFFFFSFVVFFTFRHLKLILNEDYEAMLLFVVLLFILWAIILESQTTEIKDKLCIYQSEHLNMCCCCCSCYYPWHVLN